MCGLIAIWGMADRAAATRALDVIAHRGPDGEGLLELGEGRGLLGHRRLSIIDPEGGQQPIAPTGQPYAIVANGMIYNYERLRAALPARAFATASDSEPILHLVHREGVEAVRQLDGMFAFVVASAEHLVAARDPIGIKPLYVGRRGEALVFGSEIKALLDWCEDVRPFPPGHVYDSRHGWQRYYEVPRPGGEMGVDEAIAALRQTLGEAVRKRLRADVPLGCFLSGGLDSSIITALAKRDLAARGQDELHSFAVGFPGSPDLANARLVADYLGTVHHEVAVDAATVRRALPRVLYHLESWDQDSVRSSVPCYLVARLAAKRVKVVLTGEGADELYAGYDYYRDYRDMDALQAELRRSITAMHDINLQRVDRMTMAHGLEARVPFLDTAMLDLAMRIPARLKRFAPDGRPVEKWILRQAFADLLPEDIVWRQKVQFDQGSGFADFLMAEPGSAIEAEPSAARSSEEAHYRRLLMRQFPNAQALPPLVTQWDSSARIPDAA